MTEDSNWGENTIKDKMRLEKEKIAKLSGREKWQYFKSYYMCKTIVVLAIIVVAAMIFKDVVIDKKENIISGAVVNVIMTDDYTGYLTDGYVEYINDADKDRQKASLNGHIRLHYENGEVLSSDYNNVMVLDTLIQAQQLDYIIVDKSALQYFTKHHICNNISTFITKEDYNKIRDRLYFEKNSETEEEMPVAICLAGTDLEKKYEMTPKESYLIFILNGKNHDNAGEFIKYILGI